jgi:hypothetical protein
VEELSRLGRALREAHLEYEEASAECTRLATSPEATKEQIAAADAMRREIYERYVALLSGRQEALISWELRHHGAG